MADVIQPLLATALQEGRTMLAPLRPLPTKTTGYRHRLRRAAKAMGVVIAVIGGAAACGGGPPSPGVASLGEGTGTIAGPASPNNSATYEQDEIAYAQCIRTHGDPSFPDPNSQGEFAHPPNSSSASKTCGHLLPNVTQ